MRCEACGYDNPPEHKFCGNCAAELRPHQICSKCGASNPMENRFCGHCGSQSSTSSVSSERRHITVMFCDLHRSTVLAETMDLEDYRDLINTYLSSIHNVIAEHKGFIAQDFGDGVLAYFGYPVALEDDALRAVQCSMNALKAISRLNETAEDSYGITVKVRVGVHTGHAITGNIGSERKRDQLAVGTVPNIAARIQSQAQPNEVLISDNTYKLVQRSVNVESLGSRKLKNVAESVAIYRVAGVRQQPADKEAGSTPPFIGREKEMATLLRLHTATMGGAGKLILVKGEAGIGKSRLLQEFRQASDGSQWITCRCSTFHTDSPLHPVIGSLDRLVDRDSTAESEDAAIHGLMQRAGMESTKAGEHFGTLLGRKQGDSSGPTQSQRERLELLKDWLYGLADNESVVFAIEDVHWSDPSTLELIALLARTIEESKLLLVITARSGFRLDWEPNADHHAYVDLARLDDVESERFMREWSFNSLPEEINQELIRKADGVPLYLEELTHALVTTQSTLRTTANLERFIPDSLRDLLMARIDTLGDAKEILQIGALLGRSFSRAILQTITTYPPAQLDDLLFRIVDAGLIVSHSDDVFRFKHSLIQNTAYETLLKSRRTELHSRVVGAIERDFPQMLATDPITLARHQEGAGQLGDASESYRLAGVLAWDGRNAYREAITNFDKGLALVDQLPECDANKELRAKLLHDKSRPLQAREGYANEELQPILDELKVLTRNRFNTLLSTWGYHCMNGDKEDTIEVAKKLYALVDEKKKSRQTASAKFVMGSTAFYQGSYQEASEILASVIQFGESRGLHPETQGDDSVFLAHLVIAWCSSLMGFPERAEAYLERIRRVVTKEFAVVQLKTWQMFCNEDFNRDPNLTLQLAREIETISAAHNFHRWTVLGRQFRLRAQLLKHSDASLLTELKSQLDASLKITEVTEGYDLTRTAAILIRESEFDSARRALDRAWALGEENLGSLHVPEAERLIGVLAVREGRHDSAEVRFRSAIGRATETGSRTQQLRAHISFARELPEAAGVLSNAFQKLVDSFDEGRDTPLLRQALQLTG